MLLKIVLEGCEAECKPPAIAEGTQSQINSINESFDRRRREKLRDLLTESQEKLRVLD